MKTSLYICFSLLYQTFFVADHIVFSTFLSVPVYFRMFPSIFLVLIKQNTKVHLLLIICQHTQNGIIHCFLSNTGKIYPVFHILHFRSTLLCWIMQSIQHSQQINPGFQLKNVALSVYKELISSHTQERVSNITTSIPYIFFLCALNN